MSFYFSMAATLAVFAWLAMVHLPFEAAAQSKKWTATNLQDVDDDFAYQGEYAGVAALSRQWAGLQVVALGNGKFAAVEYQGGLPGAGWDRYNKRRLHGTRSGDTLTLTGSGSGYLLKRNESTVLAQPSDSRSQPIGTALRKVHRGSPTMGQASPPSAVVLFDGTPNAALDKSPMTEEGWLKTGVTTTAPVQDFHLHVEFRTPYMPAARNQGRGNSGVYIQRRYEVQILDSFGMEGKAKKCGGLYKQRPPDLNMCLPPLSWQTYDIFFTAARWSSPANWDGVLGGAPAAFTRRRSLQKIAPARITVLHNGVAIHDHVELVSKTGNGRPEGPKPLPIHFQHHGNPVVFRNLWLLNYQLPTADLLTSYATPCYTAPFGQTPFGPAPIFHAPTAQTNCCMPAVWIPGCSTTQWPKTIWRCR